MVEPDEKFEPKPVDLGLDMSEAGSDVAARLAAEAARVRSVGQWKDSELEEALRKYGMYDAACRFRKDRYDFWRRSGCSEPSARMRSRREWIEQYAPVVVMRGWSKPARKRGRPRSRVSNDEAEVVDLVGGVSSGSRPRRNALARIRVTDETFCAPKATHAVELRWVAENVSRPLSEIDPRTCPTRAAWNLLLESVDDPKGFLFDVYKAARPRRDEEDGARAHRTTEKVMHALEAFARGFAGQQA